MALFLSTSLHKIDKKGRVSVPASFRAALEAEAFQGVALSPPLTGAPCLEGCGYSRVERMAAELEKMHPYSEQYDAMAIAILANIRQAAFDGDGRIVLPEDLIAAAELEGQALFAGLGAKFQIWRPDAFEARRAEAMAQARAQAGRLPWGGASLDQPSAGASPASETSSGGATQSAPTEGEASR